MLSAGSRPVTSPPTAPQTRRVGARKLPGMGRRGAGEAAFPDLWREGLRSHSAGQRPGSPRLLLCIVSGKETKAGCSAISDLQTLRR